jgi:hypothetical protein
MMRILDWEPESCATGSMREEVSLRARSESIRETLGHFVLQQRANETVGFTAAPALLC